MLHPAWPLLVLVIASQVPPPRTSSVVAADLRASLDQILREESRALTALAVQLEGQKKLEDSAAVRSVIPPERPRSGPMLFYPMEPYVPGAGGLGSRPPNPPAAAAIRGGTARLLLDLARQAAEPGTEHFALATECLRAVLDRDPQHREARRLLGFIPYKNGWATPQAAEELKAGKVLDPTFGWVPADWLPHLERGELPGLIVKGQPVPWLPAREADALRSDFRQRPWQISTEHFRIRTNVPLAEAIAFGRRLEAVRELFLTQFADVIDPRDLPLAQRFRKPDLWASTPTRQHEVWYFASKQEYVDFFRRQFGRDESGSLGYYMPVAEARSYRQPARSYFYRDLDNALDITATLFHEASHQLLFESGSPSGFSANLGQFWVWEGLGTYFETVTPQPDGGYLVGGLVGPRIAKARTDIVENGRFVPLAEFTTLGRARFTDEQAVYSHYAEAMAWTVFFLHGKDGQYRDEFLAYVADAYRGRFRPGGEGRGLADRIGVPSKSLDEQLKQFLADTPDELRVR